LETSSIRQFGQYLSITENSKGGSAAADGSEGTGRQRCRD
jgi:hypothetical protein